MSTLFSQTVFQAASAAKPVRFGADKLTSSHSASAATEKESPFAAFFGGGSAATANANTKGQSSWAGRLIPSQNLI